MMLRTSDDDVARPREPNPRPSGVGVSSRSSARDHASSPVVEINFASSSGSPAAWNLRIGSDAGTIEPAPDHPKRATISQAIDLPNISRMPKEEDSWTPFSPGVEPHLGIPADPVTVHDMAKHSSQPPKPEPEPAAARAATEATGSKEEDEADAASSGTELSAEQLRTSSSTKTYSDPIRRRTRSPSPRRRARPPRAQRTRRSNPRRSA